jgi:hypothetical protein
MFKYKAFIVSIFMVVSSLLLAQRTNEDDYVFSSSSAKKEKAAKQPFRERLQLGGNVSGSLGTYTFLQLNPMLGVKTTSWWTNGVGFNFMFGKRANFSNSSYGPSIWSRATIKQTFLLQTQLEQLTINYRVNNQEALKTTLPIWFIGGGIQKNGFSVLVLFNVLPNPYSPYVNPVIRVGGMFNLFRQ